ncbi:uncharacterized protein LY79DRAFT_293318 [Colletotrichum navitas]|uniref:Uncharacterized protein n=1 Tax=Colletotrichum navitas TaxID=681940 RepID=A0AAD8V2H0_9PEZI|nr:uncharacterized protein LY79DRAFT_293318 [Colletotrichum navitas]KAK1584753.1 hypothetical protein LY79DRAFT_293318 [Colletotrichum navitas]
MLANESVSLQCPSYVHSVSHRENGGVGCPEVSFLNISNLYRLGNHGLHDIKNKVPEVFARPKQRA